MITCTEMKYYTIMSTFLSSWLWVKSNVVYFTYIDYIYIYRQWKRIRGKNVVNSANTVLAYQCVKLQNSTTTLAIHLVCM